jgi:MFS family permease
MLATKKPNSAYRVLKIKLSNLLQHSAVFGPIFNKEKFIEPSPFAIGNVRGFIAFRAFFNARFYYPVFTILFLDFGLTLTQFALLNVVWAVTIVLMEVPSGALADTLGRKNLLVFAGALMVAEMALLCFAPRDDPRWLFGVFLLNRIFSGTAEASASGADEALAYDALKSAGNADDWGRVLEMQMRVQSVAYVAVMIIGAAVYDPVLMQHAAGWIGLNVTVTQSMTLRFPLYLTLLMAILTLFTTLRMDEVEHTTNPECTAVEGCAQSVARAFRLTFQAGRWILRTPFALVIILFGLLFDHIIRMLITLGSQYYRLIELPEASFGLIGSAMATLGLVIPRLAMQLARRHSPIFNMGLMAVLTLIGLMGITFFLPIAGLIPMIVLMSVMYFMGFFVSHYLNRITESHQRATVLSFKGLSFNLAYGLIGLLYSLQLYTLRNRASATGPPIHAADLQNQIFSTSISWFPGYFIVTLGVLLLFARWRLQNSREHLMADMTALDTDETRPH